MEIEAFLLKKTRKFLTLTSLGLVTSLRILFLPGDDSVNSTQERKLAERLTDDLPKPKSYSFG